MEIRKLANLKQTTAAASTAKTDTASALPLPPGPGTASARSSNPGSPNFDHDAGERSGSSDEGLGKSDLELSPEREGEGGKEVCPFLELEKKPLLKVFVFLSAPEVLRAAQVCRPMFRKVGREKSAKN